MNSEPLVSLFGGYYAGAVATSAYERRWISPLVFPLVPWLVFFDILFAPPNAAHEALVRFCVDIVSIGVIITSPTWVVTTQSIWRRNFHKHSKVKLSASVELSTENTKEVIYDVIKFIPKNCHKLHPAVTLNQVKASELWEIYDPSKVPTDAMLL